MTGSTIPRRSRLARSRELAHAGAKTLRDAAAALVSRWRRSLQMRVVGSTLAVSALVVALLGWFLVARIEEGLLAEKVRGATSEAWSGAVYTQSQLSSLGANDPEALESLQAGLIVDLAGRSGTVGRYSVVIIASERDLPPGAQRGRATGSVDQSTSIPSTLRRSVTTAPPLQQRWTYTEIRYRNGTPAQPGLVVGSRVGPWQLYYLFPLDQEQDTLSLVVRTVSLVGAALVALLVAIAYLVTRQVVTPVRMAAHIAQRFEAGRLRERMHVRGADDLARLASSFNSMAASLERQIGELEELGRVQRRFVSDVSHELRTPLTTVRMAADVIYDGRDRLDADAARAAELLQAQLDRFEALLADLLEISRYDAGAAVLEAGACDVRDLVRSVVDAEAPLLVRSGSVVELDVPDEPCMAEVDPRRVDRILRNVVGNAIRYGEGRPIEVRVGVDENAVAVTVRDHGIGLSKEQASQVFQRFWRADPARARSAGGSGLGLAIALEDARLHGGWLQATGEPGGGALFRLTLPVSTVSELRTSPLSMDLTREPPRGYTVPAETDGAAETDGVADTDDAAESPDSAESAEAVSHEA